MLFIVVNKLDRIFDEINQKSILIINSLINNLYINTLHSNIYTIHLSIM